MDVVPHAENPVEEWEDADHDNSGLYTLPPGEEGIIHSHNGEGMFQQIMEDIDPRYSFLSSILSLSSYVLYILGSGGIVAPARTAYRNRSMPGADNCRGL